MSLIKSFNSRTQEGKENDCRISDGIRNSIQDKLLDNLDQVDQDITPFLQKSEDNHHKRSVKVRRWCKYNSVGCSSEALCQKCEYTRDRTSENNLNNKFYLEEDTG